MIGAQITSIGPTPTVGFLVFDIPDVLKTALPSAKYLINSSHTKWLETHNIRFVPIDPESPNISQLLQTLNGVFFPGGVEAYDQPETLARYKSQVAKIMEVALALNQEKPFAVLATGFGAQLLIADLSNDQLPLQNTGTSRQSIKVNFAPVEASEFYKTVKKLDVLANARYPLNTDYQISVQDFRKLPKVNDSFNILATSNQVEPSGGEYVMLFEHKSLPVYGLIPDIEMIQFNHADDGFADKEIMSMDAAFQLAKFFSYILNKNPAYKTEAEVIALKDGWQFHSSAFPSGEYEDIIWRG